MLLSSVFYLKKCYMQHKMPGFPGILLITFTPAL